MSSFKAMYGHLPLPLTNDEIMVDLKKNLRNSIEKMKHNTNTKRNDKMLKILMKLKKYRERSCMFLGTPTLT